VSFWPLAHVWPGSPEKTVQPLSSFVIPSLTLPQAFPRPFIPRPVFLIERVFLQFLPVSLRGRSEVFLAPNSDVGEGVDQGKTGCNPPTGLDQSGINGAGRVRGVP